MPKSKLYKDYLPHQLMGMLTPAQVEKEFGIPKETLTYLRECTHDEGILRGPVFFKDENVILYRRDWIVKYIESHVLFFPEETNKTHKTHNRA